uniref:Uncharacterized protein n=1 Tax=Arundo donax TaxID=35708 RepID=A0A0A9B4G9_ARUDO
MESTRSIVTVAASPWDCYSYLGIFSEVGAECFRSGRWNFDPEEREQQLLLPACDQLRRLAVQHAQRRDFQGTIRGRR